MSNLINKKILGLIILSSFFVTSYAAGLDDFIITVQTNNLGSSSDTEFTIPTRSVGYDYNVDCNNDGINEFTAQTGDVTCDYSMLGGAGEYMIRIEDNTGVSTGFPRIYFNNEGDRQKITGINQWGTGQWTSMARAFQGCINLNDAGGAAADAPDLSNLITMIFIFDGASSFNQDIGNWNTANVQWMGAMFQGASAFNQDIGNWDTTSVMSMTGMFTNSGFNQDISNWDTANVESMTGMFNSTSAFNQDISNWNTANVKNMRWMFHNARVFNQDISSWDTASVTDMRSMFTGASAFNQNLGAWDVTALTNADGMFDNIALSTDNYDALLIGWDMLALQSRVKFSGGNSTYCNAEAARDNMIATNNWIITDAGLDCTAAIDDIFANDFE